MLDLSSEFNDKDLEHDHYSELCALATSGALTDSEWLDLKLHIASCPECAIRLQQNREVAKSGMALLMPDTPAAENTEQQPAWTTEFAKKELFRRIAREEADTETLHSRPALAISIRPRWSRLLRPSANAALSYVAAGLFLLAMASFAYRVGLNHAPRAATLPGLPSGADIDALQAKISDLLQQQDALRDEFHAASAEANKLAVKLQREMGERARWKSLQTTTAQDLMERDRIISELQLRYKTLSAERDDLSRKLQDSVTTLHVVQGKYESLLAQHDAELVRLTALTDRVGELSQQLKQSQDVAQQHEQFLASDLDIRELIGARKLYIADVYDVNRRGEPETPYGRVFYTAGKSLIFYAFDLDRVEKLRNASIFQAWGRRGMSNSKPLNMGIFYLDSETNKRWVLKFDDPRSLAQIDAVFVTVEPNAGSQKPTGKQLLFASLRTAPTNHP